MNRKSVVLCTAAILLAHAGMVAWIGVHRSPNIDEPAHLAAGVLTWQFGSFEVYCVNPPLMRAVATLPVLLLTPEEQWGDFRPAGLERPEFVLGAQLFESHPDRWRTFLIAAGLAILPFSVAGGLFCYAWARELFGRRAGLLALALWSFCPNVLAWSAVICTDGVAAAMGVGAGYTFWRWLKLPSWPRAATAGIMLGLAELSKMTWLFLFALWPILWGLALVWGGSHALRRRQAAQLTGILLLGLYLLNLGYALDGSFSRLGEYQFHSRLLAGEDSSSPQGKGGNRFAQSVLGQIPLPFPKCYVLGIDLQRADFERGMQSYLFGEWSERGWWYYYLVGLALKVPLGTWGLAILGATVSLRSIRRGDRKEGSASSVRSENPAGMLDQTILLAPALALIVLVSSQDGFSRHFRYVLPAFPFLFIWISRAALAPKGTPRILRGLAAGCLAWTTMSSLWIYPHSMSYFNELAGGPRHGDAFMLHSSFGWSQEDLRLKRWLEGHREVDSPYMSIDCPVSLECLGIRSRGGPPQGPLSGGESPEPAGRDSGPIPGWHVMSVQRIRDHGGGYLYFREFEPVAKAGYSINVYHVTHEEANRVRRAMGLPEIRPRQPSAEQLIFDMAAAGTPSTRVEAAVFDAAGGDGASLQVLRTAAACDPRVRLTPLTQDAIQSGEIARFDVLIVPGGSASEQGVALGNRGRQAVRRFVRDGGGYLGICAGAFLAAANHEWSLKLINAQALAGTRYVPGQGMQKASDRGQGMVQVELTDAGREILHSELGRVEMSYTGGPILFPANEPLLPEYVCLAYFRSEVWKHPFQKGSMIHSPAIVAARFGEGTVVLSSAHSETTPGLEPWFTRSLHACARRRGSGRVPMAPLTEAARSAESP